MRRACVKEMLQWFKMRPEHFFETDIYINDFLKFFVDFVSFVIVCSFVWLLGVYIFF